jgi:hypothetical protein
MIYLLLWYLIGIILVIVTFPYSSETVFHRVIILALILGIQGPFASMRR